MLALGTVVLGTIALSVIDISLTAVYHHFLSAFGGHGEQSANLRLQQWGAMVDAWKERPLLGHGLGATLHSITRSETMPWSYELFYGALLLKIGLVGVTVYAVATGWVFYPGISGS